MTRTASPSCRWSFEVPDPRPRRSKTKPAWPSTHARVKRASPQSRGLAAWWPLSCVRATSPRKCSKRDMHGSTTGLARGRMFGATPWFEGAEEITFSTGISLPGVDAEPMCVAQLQRAFHRRKDLGGTVIRTSANGTA